MKTTKVYVLEMDDAELDLVRRAADWLFRNGQTQDAAYMDYLVCQIQAGMHLTSREVEVLRIWLDRREMHDAARDQYAEPATPLTQTLWSLVR